MNLGFILYYTPEVQRLLACAGVHIIITWCDVLVPEFVLNAFTARDPLLG